MMNIQRKILFKFLSQKKNLYLNKDSLIDVIEEGISILTNDWHPQKAAHPIFFTEVGITIRFKDSH